MRQRAHPIAAKPNPGERPMPRPSCCQSPAHPASAHVSLTPRFSPTLPAHFPTDNNRGVQAPRPGLRIPRRPRRNHKRHAQCKACRRTGQIRVAPVRRQLPRIPPESLLRPLQSRHRQAIIIRPIRRIRIQHCPARRIYSHLNIHRERVPPSVRRIIRASASVSDTFIFAARSSCDD